MKVSFVIPVYKKKPEQLRKCLKDLLSQSYKNIEIICIFDGADEILQAVAKEHDISGKVYSFVIEHGGACKARNFGFSQSTGDIISFWDCDSYIEPEACMNWVKTFEKYPKAGFCYGGYKFTDPSLPAFESEMFDPWLLSKYNLISTMFPLRREYVVSWDESLDGLQDWDFWRQVVQSGAEGMFLPGYHFSTDIPDADSISGKGDQIKERIEKIRTKHSDKDSDILVVGGVYKKDAIHAAKVLDADYFWSPYWRVRDYKIILTVGFNPQDMDFVSYFFSGVQKETIKAIYWMGYDVDILFQMPYGLVSFILKEIRKIIHKNFAADKKTKEMLMEFGIESEILEFPREEGLSLDFLPLDFKTLIFCDEKHKPMMDSIVRAMPDLRFEYVVPGKNIPLREYCLVLQFLGNKRIETGTKNALMSGRWVLSNVQEPYAGYVDDEMDVAELKKVLIKRIREISKYTEINQKAKDYYLERFSPEQFRRVINGLLPVKMEVV